MCVRCPSSCPSTHSTLCSQPHNCAIPFLVLESHSPCRRQGIGASVHLRFQLLWLAEILCLNVALGAAGQPLHSLRACVLCQEMRPLGPSAPPEVAHLAINSSERHWCVPAVVASNIPACTAADSQCHERKTALACMILGSISLSNLSSPVGAL